MNYQYEAKSTVLAIACISCRRGKSSKSSRASVLNLIVCRLKKEGKKQRLLPAFLLPLFPMNFQREKSSPMESTNLTRDRPFSLPNVSVCLSGCMSCWVCIFQSLTSLSLLVCFLSLLFFSLPSFLPINSPTKPNLTNARSGFLRIWTKK